MDYLSRQCLRLSGRQGPIILMYHSIEAGTLEPDWPWAVSLERFCKQLDLLKAQGWTTLRIRDLLTEDVIPARSVVITFDDGYADNFQAFQALAERDMTATWYIVSGDVGKSSGWTDPGTPSRPMLTADQLRQMDAAGIEIGAHSRTHCRLAEIPVDRLEDEIAGSKKDLEAILGHEVVTFCFPYGSHNDIAVKVVRESGYQGACVTRTGWARLGNDPFRLRRFAVFPDDDLSRFAQKLLLAENYPGRRGLIRHVARRVQAGTGVNLGL